MDANCVTFRIISFKSNRINYISAAMFIYQSDVISHTGFSFNPWNSGNSSDNEISCNKFG